MLYPLIAVIVTGAAVASLCLLFVHERARNHRYLVGVRAPFDRMLFETRERVVYRYGVLSVRSLRQTVHFFVHQLLTVLLRVVAAAEHVLRLIVHVNRKRANTPPPAKSSEQLSAIAAHKREAELSEEEKRAKRARALEE